MDDLIPIQSDKHPYIFYKISRFTGNKYVYCPVCNGITELYDEKLYRCYCRYDIKDVELIRKTLYENGFTLDPRNRLFPDSIFSKVDVVCKVCKKEFATTVNCCKMGIECKKCRIDIKHIIKKSMIFARANNIKYIYKGYHAWKCKNRHVTRGLLLVDIKTSFRLNQEWCPECRDTFS